MLAPESLLQNRYRIVRQLGQGGMGTVYEALDERLDATVALKETLFAEERLRKQFEREARLLARMHHPALPRVSDHFSDGDGQFLVMQFIAGDDLCQMLNEKKGPFPIDQVLTWGDQLLDALDYLHTQEPQIVHRDIKPQNLKLTSRGQIILLDFGLAKGQTGGVSVITTASIFGYTPNYAPLEQIQGLGTDARSDIYSLGATLYHLMTGTKPPDALTRAAAIVNGQLDPLVPANQISDRVGPEVAHVLGRAMSQNRDQRYSTAAEMRAALKGTGEAATLVSKTEAATVILPPSAATLADVTIPKPRPTAAPGETTVVRSGGASTLRRVAPWAVAGAALLLIVVAFGGFYAFQNRTTSEEATSTTSPEVTASPIAAESVATPATAEPIAGAVDEKTAEAKQQTPADAKKNGKTPKTVERNVVQPDVQTDRVHAPNPPNVGQRVPPTQEAPETPPEASDPQYGQPTDRRRRLGGVSIRNLPDGSRVILNPDGSRVVVSPNGTTRRLPSPIRRRRAP
ncbi:MAG TPA: protein kinase [Pyrinomonadaceae bacterium]|nr:protein kinase [Pyrinomonadaceae bacterium]